MLRLILFAALVAPVLASGHRVELDPALPALAPDERAALIEEAQLCVERAHEVLARPEARAHFHRVYGLAPARLLTGEDRAVVVTTFPARRRASGPGLQVGGYAFGESTISLNVEVLRAVRRASDPERWRTYVAGVLVHEMAHLADWLDDGTNNDGGLDGEEGEEAQKAAGCSVEPPAELAAEPASLRDEVWAWRAPRRP